MKILSLSICLFVSISAYSQNVIRFNDNVVMLSKGDSTLITDPVTGQTSVEQNQGYPILINGEKIYNNRDLTINPTCKGRAGKTVKLSVYLWEELKDNLEKLDDGEYILDISSPIIDKNGHLVYYRSDGIKEIIRTPSPTPTGSSTQKNTFTRYNATTDDRRIPTKLKNEINSATLHLLKQFPQINWGQKGKQPVYATGYLFSIGSYIIVKQHNASIKGDYFSL